MTDQITDQIQSDVCEVNFDGLVGPTHNYSGLTFGNIASMSHRGVTSNPKAAALQGLEKMKLLCDMGTKQAVLPPHERPHLPTLRSLGFRGSDAEIIATCAKEAPELLLQLSSAASMWAANIATVTPSSDTLDGILHITPANLTTKLHRSIEAPFSEMLLKRIFKAPELFSCHPPLPSNYAFADEGAANHMRFCKNQGTQGIHLFVYGYRSLSSNSAAPVRYPVRYSLEAAQAIARRHQLPFANAVFAQQNPKAIDAGVFHNDVIAAGNNNFFICHEDAFVSTASVLKELNGKLRSLRCQLQSFVVSKERLSLEEAVSSYFFNSQLVTLQNGAMALIAANECQENNTVRTLIEQLIEDPAFPIHRVFYIDLRESMQNGGGPACLRLRIPLNTKQVHAIHQPIFLNDSLYSQLNAWIHQYYRDKLHPEDLYDPTLWQENMAALDALSSILKLKSLYSFQ